MVAALVLAACSPVPQVSPSPTLLATPTISTEVVLGPVRLSGVVVGDPKMSADPTCAASVQRFSLAGDFQGAVLAPGCVATADTPENGNHGFYPAPPPRARTAQIATPVGPATVFSNQYSECTSSCYMGADEVALVTVDGATVQIIAVTAPASGTTERNRDDLVRLLQGLRRA